MSRVGTLLAALAVLAAAVLRPLLHGVPGATIAVFWATALGLAVVPGVLLCHGARLAPRGDRWLLLGQGATLGLALHGLAFLAGRAAGAPWLTTAVALAAAALGLVIPRGPDRAGPEEPAVPSADPLSPDTDGAPRDDTAATTLLVILVACLVQPLVSVERLGEPVPADLLFHAGNAAEVVHRHPLENPRAAGLPLSYHLLAYALPAESAGRGGDPVADPLLAVAPLLWVGLLALQLANAGRVLFTDARAGTLAAAVALLGADPGHLLGLGRGAFGNHFATGVYGSPTTVAGLVFLAGIALLLARWLERGERRALAGAALLAAAASGAKASVLPAVLGGLGLHTAWALCRRRREEAVRAAVAGGALLAAALPLTLPLVRGEASYRTILRWGPGALFEQAPFTAAARSLLGLPEGAALGAWAPPLFATWLAGHLGLVGSGLLAWALLRRAPVSTGMRWALATAAAGFGLALALDGQGASQLFFAYNGHALLALFAGAGAVLACARPFRARPLAALALVLVFALPALESAARLVPQAVRGDLAAASAEPLPAIADYLAGLAWLRGHATRDAVVFADNPSLLLSAFGEVRLYYETGLYSPQGWEKRWAGDLEPFPERAALQERLLRRPDAAALDAARRAVRPGTRLLVVADAVPSRIERGFLHALPGRVPARRFFPEALFDVAFANGSMHVYEARQDPAAP